MRVDGRRASKQASDARSVPNIVSLHVIGRKKPLRKLPEIISSRDQALRQKRLRVIAGVCSSATRFAEVAEIHRHGIPGNAEKSLRVVDIFISSWSLSYLSFVCV